MGIISFRSFLAKQLGHPKGIWGQILVRLLNRGNAEMNDLTIEQLCLEPGDYVLEIGFGGGDLMAKLVSTGMPELIAGVERSKEALKVCSSRFRQLIQQGVVKLHQTSAENLPYLSDEFNKICTVNTIYFWSAPERVFHECRRVIRFDGTLAVCYNSSRFLEQTELANHGFTTYEVAEVESLMQNAGFAEIKTVSANSRGNGEFFCTSGQAARFS